MTLRYIGDISKQDAELLAVCAKASTSILEFGVGASTQIFASQAPGHADILSLDTDPKWIKKTKENFKLLKIDRQVKYMLFKDWQSKIGKKTFDLIFNDGEATLRKEFGDASWENLQVGGFLLYHDTRQPAPRSMIVDIIKKYYMEIEQAWFNINNSNITIIEKKKKQKYTNWNTSERRKPWEMGRARPPSRLWGDKK